MLLLKRPSPAPFALDVAFAAGWDLSSGRSTPWFVHGWLLYGLLQLTQTFSTTPWIGSTTPSTRAASLSWATWSLLVSEEIDMIKENSYHIRHCSPVAKTAVGWSFSRRWKVDCLRMYLAIEGQVKPCWPPINTCRPKRARAANSGRLWYHVVEYLPGTMLGLAGARSTPLELCLQIWKLAPPRTLLNLRISYAK